MGKHFQLRIEEDSLHYERKIANIEREASLDGIYVIRTSVQKEALSSQQVVASYKSLSGVERAFRSLLGLEDGKQLRVDTTVVETDIHYPTDATLLWDTVRTVTRLVDKLHRELPRGVQGFTNRTRSARRRMQELERMSATQRHTQQEPKYRELLRITGQVLESARQVVKKAAKVKGVDVLGRVTIDQLRQQIATYCDLGKKVIDQTRRRVLDGEQVPTDEKVYSIFEDHTHLIKPGKERKPVEFGHKVFPAESSQGLITDYQILDGNPADTTHVKPSLDRHQQVFHCAPDLYAGDRGFYRADNVDHCQRAGVSQVCIPQRGGQKTAEQETLEHSRAFKNGQRFRVGIEGRISVLFRGRGMKRCRAKGHERFEVLVGAAVLANNLLRIADLLRNRKPARPAKAA